MSNTILITGASTGIGKSTALLFQKKGWNVVATMRDLSTAGDLSSLERVLCVELDVTKPDTISRAVTRAIETFGSIDAIVNNAGYGLIGPFEDASDEQIRKQYEVNVFGVMNMIRAILPHFRSRRAGTIITISSWGGRFTFPLYSLYHGTKWAVEGLSESLQFELEQFNIRMKLVEPSIIKTNFFHGSMVLSMKPDSVYKNYADHAMPNMQHAGDTGSSPDVVARAVYKAATDNSSRLRYPCGKQSHFVLFFHRFIPDSLFRWFIRSAVEK